MPRGTQLGVLVDMLRLETRNSPSPAAGVQQRPQIVELIQRTQQWLYDEYSWPFAFISRDKALSAGSRVYSFPADLDFDRITETWTRWGGDWYSVDYGVDPLMFNAHDSDAGERNDPVRAWQHFEDDGYEVWPIPASAGTLRFRGIKRLRPLIQDADTAVLDDYLIVLYAAAEYLSVNEAEDASVKLDAANQRFRTLKAQRAVKRSEPLILGSGRRRSRYRHGLDYVSRYSSG